MDIQRCYEILEISPTATVDEIKRIYRDMVAVWHPDRFAHNPRLQERAGKKLQEMNQAYDTLTALLGEPGEAGQKKPSATPAMQLDDKRQHRRNSCQLIVDYEIQGRSYSVYYDLIQDISASGVFIETRDSCFHIGQKIKLSFSLPRLGKLMDIAGEIVRCTETGIGIKFQISPKYKKLISSFL